MLSHGQHCPRLSCILAKTPSSMKYYVVQRTWWTWILYRGPVTGNWLQRMVEWLKQNPFTSADVDVEFLTNEVPRLCGVLLRWAHEQEEPQKANAGRGGRGHWCGCLPYLQIVMCLTWDDAKRLFLTRRKVRWSWAELDACNSATTS